MTNQEIKDTGLLIRNEQQIGGNTALRVGGVIEGIGYALDNKDAANGYYQATIKGGSISVNAPNFVLGTSGNLRLKMPAAGTTASTLTIGNANAVQLWYNGAAVSAQNTWEQGEIISVFYDGTRFMASNSQGGGGDAEKIKYNNSQSGLAATNVQGALDELKIYTDFGEQTGEQVDILTGATWYNNRYIDPSTGQAVAKSGNVWKAAANISVVGYDVIRISVANLSNYAGIAFYDENGFIQGSGIVGLGAQPAFRDVTIPVPHGAVRVGISAYMDTSVGQPFCYGLQTAGGILELSGIKEDIADINNELYGSDTQPYYTTWESGYISSDGGLIYNNAYSRSGMIPTMNLVRIRSLNNSPISVNCYNAAGTHLGLYQNYAVDFEVLPTECAFIRIWYQHSPAPTAGNYVEILMKAGGVVPAVDILNKQSKAFTLLNGLSAVTFGDSITWYDGHPYNWGKESGQNAVGYQSYMRGVGMNIVNQGASGNTMLQISNIIKSYTGFAQMDYCTITSGANDSRKDVPVGTVADIGSTYNTNTFIGALQSAIDYALAQNDKLKIVLFTPIKGWIYAGGYDPVKTDDGMVREEYADAIKEVGKLYSLPVLDLYNEAGFNLLTRNVMMNDPEPPENTLYSLHPTSYGYERMASLILPFLASM